MEEAFCLIRLDIADDSANEKKTRSLAVTRLILMVRHHSKFLHLYAIVRFDPPINSERPQNTVSMSIFSSEQAAEAEANRLRKTNGSKVRLRKGKLDRPNISCLIALSLSVNSPSAYPTAMITPVSPKSRRSL